MKTEQKDERYGYVLGVIGLVAIATVILGLFAAHARFNYKIEAMESRIERQGQEIESYIFE